MVNKALTLCDSNVLLYLPKTNVGKLIGEHSTAAIILKLQASSGILNLSTLFCVDFSNKFAIVTYIFYISLAVYCT